MTTTIIIPARMASTRLPNKMLLDETGWPLIRHVYEQAKKATLVSRVVIATDHDDIAAAVRAFGGEVVMTNPTHPSGTDRLAEVVTDHITDADIIVNVQGDEPEIEPDKIDRLITVFKASDVAMATLVTRFPANANAGSGSPLDPNCVKAVLGAPVRDIGFEALYFSRSLVPYPRDDAGIIKDASTYFMHLGIYAYRPEFLKKFVALPQGKLEMTEKLEQLRILENGYKIVAGIVENATPGIDTRADYDAFVARWKTKECAE